MRHDLSSSRYGIRVRPIELEDAAFVVELRTDVGRARFLHPIPPDVDAQKGWLTAYFNRRGDYYFVAERESDRRREGLISVYDLDPKTRTAEWGRWIFRSDSNASIAAAVQVLDIAFDTLDLDRVLTRTVSKHEALVRFHESTGAKRTAILSDYLTVEGVAHNAIEHTLTSEAWLASRRTLDIMVRMMVARIEPAS